MQCSESLTVPVSLIRPNEIRIELHFRDFKSPELIKLECLGLAEKKTGSIRTKNPPSDNRYGSFQWTPAVHAMSILFAQVAAWREDATRFETDFSMPLPILEGEANTPASSLDYALSKQPHWLTDMFGCDSDGNANARLLFTRINPERKRAGPVSIQLSQKSLRNLQVEAIVDGRTIRDYRELKKLADGLRGNWKNSSVAATKGFIGSPPEADLIAKAVRENTEKCPSSMINLVHEEYTRIWESSSNEEEALKKTHDSIASLWGRLIYISQHFDIEILNPDGDAVVIANLTVANIGRVPTCGNFFEWEFENTEYSDQVEFFANDSEGLSLNISILDNYSGFKRIYCHFNKPVPPFQKLYFQLGFRAKGLFAKGMSLNSHFWEVFIYRPNNEISMTVRHVKGKKFKGCYLVNSIKNDEFVIVPSFEQELDFDSKEASFFWKRKFPLLGTRYRVYWEYYP